MTKKFIIICCLLTFVVIGHAQNVTQANDLVKKYAKDTWGFRDYPNEFLLAKITPAIRCKKLEINVVDYPFRAKGDKRRGYECRNVCRYPDTSETKRDTSLLSESDGLHHFYTCWCPIAIEWYMSAQTSDNKVITITDTAKMKRFLGNTSDIFNACLWLYLYDTTLDIPDHTSKFFRYKKVPDGLLIRYRSLISAGPVTTAVKTYLIDSNFHITLISNRKLKVFKGMVI